MSAFGTNSSISITRLLSRATASSSAGSSSMYSHDIVRFDLAPSFGVDLLVFDPVATLLVELVEADLLLLRRRRKQRDWARDQGQLEVAFPVRTRGHGTNSFEDGTWTQRDR